jgi:signal transduction histidine kinase
MRRWAGHWRSLPGLRRPWALPLRAWLALALVAVVLTPLLAWLGVIVAVMGPLKTEPTPWERRERERLAAATALIRKQAHSWKSPAFQAELRQIVQGSAISVALLDATGTPILRTGQFEHWAPIDPRSVTIESLGDRQQTGIVRDASGRVIGIYVLAQGGLDPLFFVLVSVVLGGLTLAVLVGVWWIGRSINQPIQVLAQAAEEVSQERLDFAVPTSHIQEVNQLATAFAAMRDGLRASIATQAAMEQERRLLIAGIAHDLRTPLSSVRGYLEGLRDGIARTPERMERYVSVALEKTGHLERLIADLFTFTQVEYLNQVPRKEPVALASLLQAAVDGLQPRATAAGVALRLDLPVTQAVLDLDRAMLTRVVENLLENGIRHTPAGGSVTVGYRSEPGGCRLWVADTGSGIPEADLERIFEPLYRGDQSRGTRTGGAGLGLAIARRFVAAHGGRIWAANQGGALFTVWLPA